MKKKLVKKWKGKDWFNILAPKMFDEKPLGEIPGIDAKSLLDKVIEVNLTELLEETPKYYVKLRFRAIDFDKNNIFTRFDGIDVVKEYLFRSVRKKLQKVEVINNIKTKDDWKMRIKTLTMLNKNTMRTIEKKLRLEIEKFLLDFAAKSDINDFVNAVIAGVIQHKIKKLGSKTYPVRFSEVLGVKVLSPGNQ